MDRLRSAALLPVGTLLAVYFLCRVLFQQFTDLKTGFIYPTGIVLHLFYGVGEYVWQEWHFVINDTRFIVGDACSGTTFFGLLLAYVCYRVHTQRVHLAWLLAIYPVTILANAMRVQSSIYTYEALTSVGFQQHAGFVHVVTGTVAFLCCFLVFAYWMERAQWGGRGDR